MPGAVWVIGGLAVGYAAFHDPRPSADNADALAEATTTASSSSYACAGSDESSEVASSAKDRAAEAVADTTYADQGSPYGYTQDCWGHDAGYEWAKEHEVTDASNCGGNSQSFIEGCEAYAEAYEEAVQEASSRSASADE